MNKIRKRYCLDIENTDVQTYIELNIDADITDRRLKCGDSYSLLQWGRGNNVFLLKKKMSNSNSLPSCVYKPMFEYNETVSLFDIDNCVWSGDQCEMQDVAEDTVLSRRNCASTPFRSVSPALGDNILHACNPAAKLSVGESSICNIDNFSPKRCNCNWSGSKRPKVLPECAEYADEKTCGTVFFCSWNESQNQCEEQLHQFDAEYEFLCKKNKTVYKSAFPAFTILTLIVSAIWIYWVVQKEKQSELKQRKRRTGPAIDESNIRDVKVTILHSTPSNL